MNVALFENQIPQFPDFGRVAIASTKPSQAKPTQEIYPEPHDRAQGWTFLGFLNIEATSTGRGPKSIWWTGLSNQFWWVDREHGLGGIVGAQILPFGGRIIISFHSSQHLERDSG
jgi:CubicO group peptidase (beta-lactamase class C family)